MLVIAIILTFLPSLHSSTIHPKEEYQFYPQNNQQDQFLPMNTDPRDAEDSYVEFSRQICRPEDSVLFLHLMADETQVYHICDMKQDLLNLHFTEKEIKQEGLKKLAEKTCAIPECKVAYRNMIKYKLAPDCVLEMEGKPLNLYQLLYSIDELCDRNDESAIDSLEAELNPSYTNPRGRNANPNAPHP